MSLTSNSSLNYNQLMKTFNRESIRKLRKNANLSQTQFAQMLGDTVKKQHVSNWENGINRPDTLSLERIANVFGLSMDYFFADSDSSVNNKEPK